jgi:hypothetical protein
MHYEPNTPLSISRPTGSMCPEWRSARDDVDPLVVVPRSRPDTRACRLFDRAAYLQERRAAIARGIAVAPTLAELLQSLLRVAS